MGTHFFFFDIGFVAHWAYHQPEQHEAAYNIFQVWVEKICV